MERYDLRGNAQPTKSRCGNVSVRSPASAKARQRWYRADQAGQFVTAAPVSGSKFWRRIYVMACANCAGAQPSPLSPCLRLRSASEQTLPSSVSSMLFSCVLCRTPNADRLTILWSGLGYSNRAPSSASSCIRFASGTKRFDQVAGISVTNGPLPGEGDAEQVKVADVTSNFLPLRTRPLSAASSVQKKMRRTQRAPSSSPTEFGSQFGSDPAIIGKLVRVSATFCGCRWVSNCRLRFPDDASVPPEVDVYSSIPVGPWEPQGPAFLHVIGRLRNGSNAASAQAEGDAIATQINALAGDRRWRISDFMFSPFKQTTCATSAGTLLLLFGGVVLVLLIGCANIANLLMARARQRQQETTIRARARSVARQTGESTVHRESFARLFRWHRGIGPWLGRNTSHPGSPSSFVRKPRRRQPRLARSRVHLCRSHWSSVSSASPP